MGSLANLALDIGAASKGSKATTDVADILTFAEAQWGLGMELYPVQRVILKLHYGMELDDNPYQLDLSKPVPKGHPKYDQITLGKKRPRQALSLANTYKDVMAPDDWCDLYENVVPVSDWRRKTWRFMSEVEYLKYLYKKGQCNVKAAPGVELRVMLLSVGRRSGKTQMASVIGAYETYKLISKHDPQAYYGLPAGEPIQLISVATDKEQAGILYSKVAGYYKDCFAGETEVITDEGVRPISELAGQSPTLLTRHGAWVEAPVRAFGEQRLWRVVLRRQGAEKVVYCTENHRWFARDARKAYRDKGYQEFLTRDLRPGKHRLQQAFGKTYKNRVKPSPFGVAHGFTFGDGVAAPGIRQANRAILYGEKDKELLPYFSGCPQYTDTKGGLVVSALPNYFRERPAITENKSYLLGWLMGYFAADGSVSNGQVVMSSANEEDLKFFRDVCHVLGIGTYDIRPDTRVSNLTGRGHTQYRMALMRQTLSEDFFVIPAHRNSFVEAGGDKVKRDASAWTVVSVNPTDRVEQVFCATVENEAAFALEGNILTGNCAFFTPYTANNTMSYARFQTPKDISRYGRYAEDEKANATIRVTFRPCRAKGLRGAGNIVIILDEMAHFTDAGQSSASEVWNAVKPSMSAFSPATGGDVEGRMIGITSPLGRQGEFYKQFQLAMSGAPNMLAIQAPTWEVNPFVAGSELEQAFRADPTVFFTEYGGHFTDRTRGWIEDEDDLMACVIPDLRPKMRGLVRTPHYVGLDFALAGDGTAIAIGHLTPENEIELDYLEEIRAGEGKYEHLERLEFDDVADWVLDLSKRFMFAEGLFDQWSGIVIEQALHNRGLKMLRSEHLPKQVTAQMFRNFKDMMWDKRLRLYDWPKPPKTEQDESDHCPYISELLELQATKDSKKSKYLLTVEAPQVKGKHDDMSDALVRMVWCASQRIVKPKHIAGRRRAAQHPNTPPRAQTAQQARKARIKAMRPGGSSPDRQPRGRGKSFGRRR